MAAKVAAKLYDLDTYRRHPDPLGLVFAELMLLTRENRRLRASLAASCALNARLLGQLRDTATRTKWKLPVRSARNAHKMDMSR